MVGSNAVRYPVNGIGVVRVHLYITHERVIVRGKAMVCVGLVPYVQVTVSLSTARRVQVRVQLRLTLLRYVFVTLTCLGGIDSCCR